MTVWEDCPERYCPKGHQYCSDQCADDGVCCQCIIEEDEDFNTEFPNENDKYFGDEYE